MFWASIGGHDRFLLVNSVHEAVQGDAERGSAMHGMVRGCRNGAPFAIQGVARVVARVGLGNVVVVSASGVSVASARIF